MTLALLLTAVGGAWAQSSLKVVEFEVPADWANDNTQFTAADLPGFKTSTLDEAKAWTGAPAKGVAVLFFAFDGENAYFVAFENGVRSNVSQTKLQKNIVFIQKSDVKFYYTADPNFIDVKWDAATKTGNFVMPAFDVEIAPIYAPTAMFATDGNLVLTPTAIEGIYAESTDAIVKAGTVAKIGETENPQGIVMYAVTSANQATAPELSAFSADVPTAKDITAAGDVLVWYYIKGADTPQGQTATAENTFNDSEICAEPITVTVLSNKFDIQFKAANDNTIEAGKATVTVGGTAATVTEGKLEGVKMGSEVKVKAKDGYKFRKVEVKKKAAAKPLANATAEDLGKVVGADGNIYDTKDAAEAANTTAVAMIAYVGSETADDTYTNGLAIALADESGTMNWNTAKSTCEGKTAVNGAKWMLPKVEQVHMMCIACGGYPSRHFGLDNALATAGGNKMSGTYWTSSQKEGRSNRYYDFSFNENSDNYSENDSNYAVTYLVRACLAF